MNALAWPVPVLAWAGAILTLAGCAAYARAALRGHQGGCLRRAAAARITRAVLLTAIAVLGIGWVRAAVLRARWAWRCRGKPVPGDGEPLTREEIQVLGNLDAGRDVRSRT